MATKVLQRLLRVKVVCPVRRYSAIDTTAPPKQLNYNNNSKLIRIGQSNGWHTSTRHRTVTGKDSDIINSYDRRWLRENCRCQDCYNHATSQRNIVFSELEAERMEITDVQMHEAGDNITIKWADDHLSVYNLDWLRNNSYPGNGEYITRRFWDGTTMDVKHLDLVPRDVYISDSGDGLTRLLNSLLIYGVGIVTDVEASVEATQQVSEQMCFIQETLYGRMWSFTSNMARADTAYTNLALGAHTDTSYMAVPAGIQVFHCLQHDGTGGQTLLVDGFHAANRLRMDDPEAFDTLCKHRIHHETKEGDAHNLRSLDPVLKVHPVFGELEMIRYNHYDRAPISTIPQNDMPGYYNALAALTSRVADPGAGFWIKLVPGMVLFVDNWRVLHGRSAFTGLRRMCGCYLPRDDWVGRARVTGLIL